MLAITKRDKIFSLFALPIAIIGLYIFVFGGELHKQNAAYDEHIAQMGTEEEPICFASWFFPNFFFQDAVPYR